MIFCFNLRSDRVSHQAQKGYLLCTFFSRQPRKSWCWPARMSLKPNNRSRLSAGLVVTDEKAAAHLDPVIVESYRMREMAKFSLALSPDQHCHSCISHLQYVLVFA
jgi:hypothetical protein